MATYFGSYELDDDRVVEQLLAGRLGSSGDDLNAVSSFVSEVRSMSDTTPVVVSAELADIFERGLPPGAAEHSPAAAVRPASKTTRGQRMRRSLSAALATMAGKVAVGTVAVAAGVGGAHAAGAVDIPGLPDAAPTTAENAPANDGATDRSDEKPDADTGQHDGAGVDGSDVSERAKDGEPQEDGRGFGSDVADDATDGTPAEDTPADDRPTDPGDAGSDAPAGGSDTADEYLPDGTPTGRP